MQPVGPSERRALRARAHALKPVVMVSDAGLSEGVVAEIDRCLKAHELIKIRVTGDRVQREALLGHICERTGATPVQHIGKILVVYRESPAEPPPKPKRDAVRRKLPAAPGTRSGARGTPGVPRAAPLGRRGATPATRGRAPSRKAGSGPRYS